MMNHTLSITHLSKTYRNGVIALDDVSLEISNGMFGLLGPNGAGKSTLMRTIATLQPPTSGTITLNGKDVQVSPFEIRNTLGYLPQEFGVYPRISAQSLLNHIAILKGILNKKDREKQVQHVLTLTNIYSHRKKSVSTFSGGMRQRFGIAQALLGSPSLIIVDEPTSGLDPEERNRFLNLLSEVGENVIVLLSTHIVEDVQNLCSRVAIMGGGKVLQDGNPTVMMNQLNGKIWKKIIEKKMLPIYQKNMEVISMKLIEGKTQVCVHAEECPAPGFKSAQPSLQDVYFYTLPKPTSTLS